MIKTKGYSILFALVMLSFCCLLLSGGSRLIAMPQEESAPILPSVSWMNASLSCPPSVQVQSLHTVQQTEGKRACLMPDRVEAMDRFVHASQTDSNGNILRRASYMRDVYQVFALGDGFV